MDRVKLILAMVLGVAATFFQQYGIIIALVAVMIVMDFITGLVKSKVTGVNWSSSKGTVGFWKKLALLLALLFGILLDYVIPVLLESGFNFDLSFNLPFGLIVGAYILVNEVISVCENFHESGVKLPKVITNLLTKAKDKITEETDD